MRLKMVHKLTDMFTWERLDHLCYYCMSLGECAAIIGCSETYIKDKIRAEHDMTFLEYRKTKFSHAILKGKKQLFKMALGEQPDWRAVYAFNKNFCGIQENPIHLDDSQSDLEWT